MKISILTIALLLLVSCKGEENSTLPIGKWAGVTGSIHYDAPIKEYCELHITSKEIYISSHWDIDIRSIKYSVRGDSLYYTEFDYSVGFRLINDSSIILSIKEYEVENIL